MPRVLIGHNQKYNIFSTITNSPVFEKALTEKNLKEWHKQQYGESSMLEFNKRVQRCKQNGTSSMIYKDLKSVISCNRAGINERCVPYDEFIKKYL